VPLAKAPGTDAFILRRALNAHFRLGQKENASALASFAANDNSTEALRVEALELLSLWAKPPARDHVVGLYRPLPLRDSAVAAHELDSVLAKIEAKAPSSVKLAAKKTATALADHNATPVLTPQEFAKLSGTLETGTIPEKQTALAALAGVNDDRAATLLTAWLDKLLAAEVPKELRLDVLEAAQKNQSLVTSAATKAQLERYDAGRDSHDPLAKWRDCLYGGNPDDGRKTFMERQDLACLRCHKINGEGGDVGPDLAGIGQRQTREYILESILFPNKIIAPGFESAIVTLKNGTSYAGVVKSENDAQLILNSAEDGLLTLKKADIQKRDHGLSAMPDGVADILSKHELRNLLEFLARDPQPASKSLDK